MGAAALKVNSEPANGEWLSKSAIAKRVKLHVQTVTSRLEDLGYEPDEDRSTPKNQVFGSMTRWSLPSSRPRTR
jgi:hypothetical protein